MADDVIRFEIRVKPEAKGPSVGGTWGDDGPLNVSVAAKANAGKANAAAIEILATVLRVRKRQLRIVAGHSHRTKLVELSEATDDARQRLEHWRNRQ